MYVIEKEFNSIFYDDNTDLQSIRTSCITSIESFKKIKNDWNNLLEKSREPHPFISWEWQYTWWETYAEKKR